MLRSGFSISVTGRCPRAQKFSGCRIREIEPIPFGAINRNNSFPEISEGERERYGFWMIFVCMERDCYLARAQIDDLTVVSVVVNDGDKLAVVRRVQSFRQRMSVPGFVIGLSRNS